MNTQYYNKGCPAGMFFMHFVEKEVKAVLKNTTFIRIPVLPNPVLKYLIQTNAHCMEKIIKRDVFFVLLLLLAWLLAEWLVWPVGEFPIDDDWSYTLSLQNLHFKHRLLLSGFTSMTLVAQLAWANLFCDVFGWSFMVIRSSTIVLGAIGVIAVFYLLKEVTSNRKLAFLGSLLLVCNPVYLHLSNSFMTDIPFAAALFLSFLFFTKALQQDKKIYIVLAVVFSIAATLVRQLGILPVLCFAIVYSWQHRFSKKAIAASVLALFITIGIYYYYNYRLRTGQGYPLMYAEGTNKIKNNLLAPGAAPLSFLFKQSFFLLIYCGFFVFPFALLFFRKTIFRSRGLLIAFLSLFVFTLAYCLWYKKTMPFVGNVFDRYGMGVTSLRDIIILKLPNLPEQPQALWVLITFTGAAGAAMALYGLLRLMKKKLRMSIFSTQPAVGFMVLFILAYCAVLVATAPFDRYFLPLVPPVCIVVWYAFQKTTMLSNSTFALALLVLVVYAWLSVNNTHNQFAWNRARWKALHYLTNDLHISPEQIDGGFEFNGYYLFDNTMNWQEDPAQKSWWWVKDDEYLLSFGPVNGYTTFQAYPYRKFLQPAADSIYVLKRMAAK